MIFKKPLDYSREKVTEVVNSELINIFGTLYDKREKNLPRDLNTLLAHISVYPLENNESSIYLKCAYADFNTFGFIKKPD